MTGQIVSARVTVLIAVLTLAPGANAAGAFVIPASSVVATVTAPGTIRGRVVDRDTREGIGGVQVFVGARLATVTTNDGAFVLRAVEPGPATLRARRVGFTPGEQQIVVPDGGETEVTITLERAVTRLDEVVTTATGEQRRVEVGHSIGVVAADSLTRAAPITNLGELLSARVPGAQVLLQNGFTGSSPRIRIRGFNSFTVTNNPLLIIDGIRAENTQSSGGTPGPVASYGQATGRLADLNPEEIESVEIVKGPSAATLYGTDAANGVIVITTKKGRAEGVQWRVYAEGGRITMPAEFPTSYYGWGRSPAGAQVQCVLQSIATGACTQDSISQWNPMMNSETRPFDNGSRGQLGAQTSGGVQQFRYFVSGEVEGETGVLRMPDAEQRRVSVERGGASVPAEQIRPNAFRKVSLRGNVSAPLGQSADVVLSNGLVLSRTRIPTVNIYQSGVWSVGYRNVNDGFGSGRPGELFAVRNNEDLTRYTGSAAANWRPAGWFASRGTVGMDFSSNFTDGLQRRGEGPLGVNRDGRRLNQRNNVTHFTFDLGSTATFTPNASLTSRTTVGAQYNRRLDYATSTSAAGLPPGSSTVTGGATLTGSERTEQSVVAGGYVQEVVGWKERLFLTAAVRADGGSTFGSDFNTAVYPKAGLSWVMTEEPWLPRIPSVSSVRLRVAYGTSGVQPSAIASLPTVVLGNALVNGVSVNAARQGALGNPGLGPERQAEFEAGFDAEASGGRARLEFTYYNRRSRDALINRPLAPSSGVTGRLENLGRVRNLGYEGLVTARLVDRAPFALDVSLNGSINKNKLITLGTGVTAIPGSKSWRHAPGYPLFGAWERPINDYADANGNGIIEPSEIRLGDTEVFRGSTTPSRQLTAGTTVSLFRNVLRVNVLFDHRGGYTLVAYEDINRCAVIVSSCREVIDRTTPLDQQVAGAAYRAYNDWWGFFQDGAFTRLRELGVSIQAPTRYARLARARDLTLTLTGRNLALWTAYTGVDPEVNSNTGTDQSATNPTAPPSRYWLARLTLGF